MEFINIRTALFSSPEFIGAEPVQRATWIALLAWCCEQENGGMIPACRSWGMRRWMQTCGVTEEEIGEGCELYSWDGDDLNVFGYPKHIQANLEVKRTIARENGKLGGRPRKTDVGTDGETEMETDGKPTLVSKKTDVGTDVGTETGTNVETDIATYGETVREGKGRERKVREDDEAPPSSGRRKALPANAEEVRRYMAAQVKRPSDEQLAACAEKFFNKMDAIGWRTNKGVPVDNWRGAARQYASDWQSNEALNRSYGLEGAKPGPYGTGGDQAGPGVTLADPRFNFSVRKEAGKA